MSQIKDIPKESHDEVFRGAVERRLPVVLTRKADNTWVSCKSRFLAEGADQTLIIEAPGPSEAGTPVEFAPGDHVGLSFRRGHKKCLCSASVAHFTNFSLDDGSRIPALTIQKPQTVRQLQRRAYNRSAVQPPLAFDVAFWEGGLDALAGPSRGEMAVYVGTLEDISAGGFCLTVPADRDPQLAIGDTVGCRLSTNPDRPAIAFDANFRYATAANQGEIHLGFQIVGLETTAEGMQTLQKISQFAAGLQRGSSGRSRR
jgi:hypothetical protein